MDEAETGKNTRNFPDNFAVVKICNQTFPERWSVITFQNKSWLFFLIKSTLQIDMQNNSWNLPTKWLLKEALYAKQHLKIDSCLEIKTLVLMCACTLIIRVGSCWLKFPQPFLVKFKHFSLNSRGAKLDIKFAKSDTLVDTRTRMIRDENHC